MIKYFKKDGEFLVLQVIKSISLYDLEGSLDKVISFLQKEESLSLKEMQIYGDYNYLPKNVLDYKLKIKTVKFDYFQLEVGRDYDGENQLQLVGYRKMINEEKEIFEQEEQIINAKQLDRKYQEYERLKRELNK